MNVLSLKKKMKRIKDKYPNVDINNSNMIDELVEYNKARVELFELEIKNSGNKNLTKLERKARELSLINLQNLNGREYIEEIFEAGILVGLTHNQISKETIQNICKDNTYLLDTPEVKQIIKLVTNS